MARECSYCGSANVRRSGSPKSEASAHPFHSPYRCRDCGKRFWVVSRKIYVSAAIAGTVIVSASLMLAGEALLAHRDNELALHPGAHQRGGPVSPSEAPMTPSSPEESGATRNETRRPNGILFQQPPADP
jgi:hypothetical protein